MMNDQLQDGLKCFWRTVAAYTENNSIGGAAGEYFAAADEIECLTDQVVVDTAIIKAHNVEIRRLRDVLELYGEHLPDCGVVSEEPVCTCGLVQPPVLN